MKIGTQMCVLLMLVIITVSSRAQLKTESFALGFGGGGVLGDMDFGRDDNINPYGSVWLRHAIYGMLEGQATGNFLGKLSRDKDNPYETQIYSADYRLLLRPFSGNVFSIYLYGGLGGLYYDVEQATIISSMAKASGWEMVAPAGGGIQLALSDYVSLDAAGGYNFTNTDALNLVERKREDGYFGARVGLTIKLQTGTTDRDKDGLSDREERRLGTNPNVADTDTDGLSDGEEWLEYRTHPLRIDSDNDGLNDYQEVREYRTNPRERDSDGDRLSDAEEVFTYKTNPLKADSDGDGLNDKDEVVVHRTDPNKRDTDEDGLNDGEELTTYKTDPLKSDTDNDRLTDKEEVSVTNTDLLNPDTDGDGLPDGDEVRIHRTDPLNIDTDRGGIDDFTEVKRATDPLNKDDDGVFDVKNVGDKIVLDGIIFATNSAQISPQSELILEKAYNTMVANPEMDVEIHGYTDNVGSYEYNLTLSQKRAEAVRRYLIGKGISPQRLSAKGLGPANPVASNSTADGRARNRRIEFVRVK